MYKKTTTLLKILNLKRKVKVIQGGQGAGKTIAILLILIDYAIKYENKVVTVVTDSYPNLEKGAIRDFLKIMKTTNRFYRSSWHGTKHKYTFYNNSIIEFVSLDKGDSGLGARRDILYVNEATRVDFKTYNFISARTHSHIFIDYNPLEKFWVHNELIKREACDFISVTYKDNEFLPQSEIDFILEKKEWAKTSEYWLNWYRIFGEGKVGSIVEGVLYASSFSRKKHVAPTKIGNGRLFLCFDFNVNPMTCTFAESKPSEVVIHSELELENSDVESFCELINTVYAKYLDRIL